jgi:glyoxylate/hydroxypyruvate reductase A
MAERPMVLLIQAREPRPFVEEFARCMPALKVRVWPDVGAPEDISFAFVSRITPGVLGGLPNLKFVASLLAGVEHLVSNPEIPLDLPIVRTGSPHGDAMMTEYVLMHVLRHHRNVPAYALQQGRAEWTGIPQKPSNERGIGFLGLGLLGRAAALCVRDHGFKVFAWTRNPRQEVGITCFSGPEGLGAMLSSAEILVNLLPATRETEDIVNAAFLAKLPRGAQFINVARGQHVVDADLIAALDSGQLTAATLDAFREEPLPAESMLWRHPRITIMPHVARRALPQDSVPQVVENIRRARAGVPLQLVVDRQVGY